MHELLHDAAHAREHLEGRGQLVAGNAGDGRMQVQLLQRRQFRMVLQAQLQDALGQGLGLGAALHLLQHDDEARIVQAQRHVGRAAHLAQHAGTGPHRGLGHLGPMGALQVLQVGQAQHHHGAKGVHAQRTHRQRHQQARQFAAVQQAGPAVQAGTVAALGGVAHQVAGAEVQRIGKDQDLQPRAGEHAVAVSGSCAKTS